MATQEVTKYSVYDPRIVQTKPKYAVEKGALSLTNVTFNAQTANATAQQFNVIVPSENVFIDRAVEWVSGGVVQIPVTLTIASASAGAGVATLPSGIPLLTYNDVSLAAFPSHQTVAQMTATINDATVTINTQDVLNNVLRLQDLSKHRKQRTCPTMLDRYAYNYPVNSASSALPAVLNSPAGGFSQAYADDLSPNGAFSNWWFCDSAGTPLTTSASSAGQTSAAYGLPLTTSVTTTTASAAVTQTQNVYIRWQSSEHLLLPPFIFGDDYELSTGLFGVQNFQVQMNMATSPARAIRIASDVIGSTIANTGPSAGSAGLTSTISIGSITWASTGTTYSPQPIAPSLSVQFLTPALDVPLPPKSIVPYMEFPRYITTGLASVPSTLGGVPSAKGVVTGSTQVLSNTITLPNIPDLLMFYLKPATVGQTGVFASAPYPGATTSFDSTIGDFTLPIEGISMNFDNFSGLLANHTQYQLYRMSRNNGVEMDYPTWCGESRERAYGVAGTSNTATFVTAVASGTGANLLSPYVSTAGGPLVLRPGRDFALQAGQAPGLVGNFTLQVTLTVGNQFAQAITAGGVNLYVVPISTGFFETIKGSSRIIKGVLTEQDILGSAAHAPEADLDRKVGSGKSLAKKMGKMALGAYM